MINALLSRCRTYILKEISEEEIIRFLMKNKERIQERYSKILLQDEENLKLIAHLGNGDLRNTLNLLETACILQ